MFTFYLFFDEQEIQSVTLNDRRNVRLSFVKENKYKVGLNLVRILSER